MTVGINRRDYKDVSEVLRNAKSKVSMASIWKRLHQEYGVGSPINNGYALSAPDRVKVANVVKAITGFDPRFDKYEDLVNQTRTENSDKGRFEKLFSVPPRERFIEARYFQEDALTQGYVGQTVADILGVNPDLVVSVENFDTFVWMDGSYVADVLLQGCDYSSVVIVYRGDNKACPKAISSLRSQYSGLWVHYGDFDLSGLMHGLHELKADYLAVPELDALTKLTAKDKWVSRSDVFEQQLALLPLLSSYSGDVGECVRYINLGKMSVMQEKLCIKRLPLKLISGLVDR